VWPHVGTAWCRGRPNRSAGGNFDIHRSPLSGGRSLYWASLNRGKRSVEIDYRRPEGRRLVRGLLGHAGDGGGILVTNLPLKDDLADAELLRWRPDLIVIRLSGSPDGRSELDYTVNCAVGFPLITGHSGDTPVNHVLPAWDGLAGLTLAVAVLAAERSAGTPDAGRWSDCRCRMSPWAWWPTWVTSPMSR